MTLNEFIGNQDDVFFDEFGESAKLYHSGNRDHFTDIVCIWDAAAVEGTNQVPGDGIVVDGRPAGDLHRKSIMIELPIGTPINETADPPDVFVLSSTCEAARLIRVVSRDPWMMTVLASRLDAVWAKRRGIRS